MHYAFAAYIEVEKWAKSSGRKTLGEIGMLVWGLCYLEGSLSLSLSLTHRLVCAEEAPARLRYFCYEIAGPPWARAWKESRRWNCFTRNFWIGCTNANAAVNSESWRPRAHTRAYQKICDWPDEIGSGGGRGSSPLQYILFGIMQEYHCKRGNGRFVFQLYSVIPQPQAVATEAEAGGKRADFLTRRHAVAERSLDFIQSLYTRVLPLMPFLLRSKTFSSGGLDPSFALP